MKPTAELKRITPSLAKKWLERAYKDETFVNRSLSQYTVDRYAESMKNGEWKISNDSICLDDLSVPINGQHRLEACVKADVSFENFVISNMPRENFDVWDIGKRRSASDALSCIGEANVCVLSSSLIAIEKYMTGRMGAEGTVRADNIKIQALLQKYIEVRDSTNYGNKRWRTMFRSTAIPVSCHYLFSRKDPELAASFMEDLATGQNLQAGSPIYLLREKLISNTLSKAKLPADHLMALTIKAWNSLRKGKTMKSLQFQEKEIYPIVE